MGKGRRLAEFRWDVYADSYRWVFLREVPHIDPRWQRWEGSEPEDPFLVLPLAAMHWPATPDLTIGGPPSPPWKAPDSAPPKKWGRSQSLPPPEFPDVQPSRRYSPFEVKNLFRAFAEVECREESILKFARRYGHLGTGVLLGTGIDDPLGSKVFGEPMHHWTKEIHALRAAVTVWDRVAAKDQRWLKDRIRWERDSDGMAVMYEDPEKTEEMVPGQSYRSAVIASRHLRPEGLRVLRSRDVFQAGRVLVIADVNERLELYTMARTLFDDSGGDLGLHVLPRNLLGAIWLAFSRSLTDQWPYRSCSHCGQWTQVAPQGQSRQRVFCNASCRGKAYRKMPH